MTQEILEVRKYSKKNMKGKMKMSSMKSRKSSKSRKMWSRTRGWENCDCSRLELICNLCDRLLNIYKGQRQNKNLRGWLN